VHTTKHKVKLNETLSEIARDFDVTVDALAAANSDSSHLLQAGHYIWIPTSQSAGGDESEPSEVQTNHKVHQAASSMSRRWKSLLLILGTTAVVAIAWLSYPFLCKRYPFPCRYSVERCRTLLDTFGETGAVVLHIGITLTAALGIWLLNRLKNPKTTFQVLSVILVISLSVLVTLNVTYYHHIKVASKAEEDASATALYALEEVQRLETADAEAAKALDAAAKKNVPPVETTETRHTSELIILDQAIARIVSYIHVIVRNEFPHFRLRAASLHLQLNTKSEDQKIWNVIQEGDEPKDAPFLPSNSLVGMTIKTGQRRYCPDVLQPDGSADCLTYKLVSKSPPPRYRSLICFPLKGSKPQEVLAGLCFDSEIDRAFNRQENELELRLTKSMKDLNSLLVHYQNYQNDLLKVIKTPAKKD
jgi:hypothetical protein